MKRRILLLMMTALFSVGAWAQTVTIFENAGGTEVGYSAPLSLNDAKQQLRSARVGSQLIITLSVPSAGANVFLYGSGYGYDTELWGGWQNEMNGSLSCLLTADAISAINNDEEGWGLWIRGGASFTVTKVTLSYNGVNLTSNFEANSKYNNYSGAFQLKKSILTNASEGAILQVSVSSENFNGDWHMLSLTNGQGDFESMGDATVVYNAVPTSTEVTLEASSFSDITIGDLLTFNTTVDGLKAVSGETTLFDNMWWCTNGTALVTYDNINTIKANGIIVTVNRLKDDYDNDNTLTVKKANPSGTIAYWGTKDFSAGSTVNIPLTSALLGHANEGESEGNLYLGGYGFTASSVDLIYQPSAVNIGSTGYATFGYPFAVDLSRLSASQDAYTVTVNGDEAQLTSVKGMKIPANTGIILEGANGDEISLPLTTASTDEIGTNNLHVSDGTVTGETGDESTIYALANKNDVVGFYLVDDVVTVPAGKAYLQISGSVALARAFIGFGDDNGTTGIDEVRSNTEEVRSDYFDLQGRRVAQPTKGLYIVNGKKVIIK